jgi:hypothetical protein
MLQPEIAMSNLAGEGRVHATRHRYRKVAALATTDEHLLPDGARIICAALVARPVAQLLSEGSLRAKGLRFTDQNSSLERTGTFRLRSPSH